MTPTFTTVGSSSVLSEQINDLGVDVEALLDAEDDEIRLNLPSIVNQLHSIEATYETVLAEAAA
jgi:hypothetical protein